METIRQQKIARLLQKEVGEIFNKKEISNLQSMMVSVTHAKISPDLSIARIYLSLFPADNKKEAIENIRENTATVRYHLGKRVGKQLRHIPQLHFYLDDSFDYAEKIDQLLK